MTEVMAFFQVPHITAEDIKNKAQHGLVKFAEISRAGLRHAVEQHKVGGSVIYV